jgi:hypothetical protein
MKGSGEDGSRSLSAIVGAVRRGLLREPFSRQDFRTACPGFGNGTYNAFLDKHRSGDPGGNSELFERVAPDQFKCSQPFRYKV